MAKLYISFENCIGCNVCVDLCPELFKSTDFIPECSDVDVSSNKCAHDSIDFCPVQAISIK